MGLTYSTPRQVATPLKRADTADVGRDVWSKRDWVFDPLTGVIAASVSLRSKMPVVGECPPGRGVACALATLVAYDTRGEMRPSVDFIHYNAKRLMGEASAGGGGVMTIRSGFSAIKRHGLCHNDTFPMNDFYDDIAPSDVCYQEGALYTAFEYYRVHNDDLLELCKCIATGFPVVFGLEMLASASFDNRGKLVHDDDDDGGGDDDAPRSFALVAVGYDDATSLVEFRSFRGDAWGDGGYGYIDYGYMAKHAHSMWVLRSEDYDQDDGPVSMF